MAKKKEKWIQKAIRKPGALTRTAEGRGMTPTQLCHQPNLSATTERRCRLMETLKRVRP